MKIKQDWVMFVGKESNNNTSWNISTAFLESCLSISEVNECLTSVNMKRNKQAQR